MNFRKASAVGEIAPNFLRSLSRQTQTKTATLTTPVSFSYLTCLEFLAAAMNAQTFLKLVDSFEMGMREAIKSVTNDYESTELHLPTNEQETNEREQSLTEIAEFAKMLLAEHFMLAIADAPPHVTSSTTLPTTSGTFKIEKMKCSKLCHYNRL